MKFNHTQYSILNTQHRPRGQSLVEILIAIALGVVLIGGSVTLMSVSLRGYRSFKNHLEAIVSTRQAMEITQAIIRANWHSIADLTPGIHYKIAKRGNAYTFQKGEEKVFDDTNLVAYWNMDEGSGQMAYDNKNTNNGILINSPTWKSGSDCVNSNCLEFNGSSNYVNFSDISVTENINQLTVSAWIYSNPTTTYRTVISKGYHTSGSWEFRMTRDSEGPDLNFAVVTAGGKVGSTIAGYENSAWHHVVGVYDGSRTYVYKDGELIDSDIQTGNIIDTSHTVKIGTNGNVPTTGEFWNGSIDEVRIYNTALSAEEIREHYKAGLDKLGLVGYWSMDENGDTTAYDNANSNDGTLYNSPTWKSGSDCISGTCLEFNGSTNYVGVTSNEILKPAIITVEAWVKLTDSTLRRQLFLTKWYGYSCETDIDHRPFFRIRDGGDSPKGDAFIVGDWYHFVGVYDPTGTAEYQGNTLYINGQRIGTTPNANPITHSDNILTIGKYEGGLHWGGLIDEVRVYNRALIEQEINNRYQAGYTRYIVFNKTSRTSGNIDTTYNSNNDDTSTLKAISTIKYGEGLVSEQSGGILSAANYFTRSENSKVLHQTDWSGESGITGPVSNPSNQYDTSTNIATSTAGQITMATTTSDGTLTSSILDTGVSSGAGFNSLLWQGSLGTGGTVKFQIAFSNEEDGPWTYYGPTSVSDWYQPNPGVSFSFPAVGSASPQNKRYIRYKINLSTTSTTPQINDIIINWTP